MRSKQIGNAEGIVGLSEDDTELVEEDVTAHELAVIAAEENNLTAGLTLVDAPPAHRPDLPGGSVTLTVPFNGHTTGKDDNGNGSLKRTDSDDADTGDATKVNPGEKTPIDKVAKDFDQENSGIWYVDDKNNPVGDKIAGATVEKGKDGKYVVSIPRDAKAGKAVVLLKDKDGKEIDRFYIEIAGGATTPGGSSVEDIDLAKCIRTAAGFGLPLLALAPIGLALTVGLPGLEPVFDQMSDNIAQANANIQAQLGILNPQMAAQIKVVNDQLRQFGLDIVTAGATLAIIPVAILAAVLIANTCMPKGPEFIPGSKNDSSPRQPALVLRRGAFAWRRLLQPQSGGNRQPHGMFT